MEVKKEKWMEVHLKGDDVGLFCEVIKKLVSDQKKVGLKRDLFTEDEQRLIEDIDKKL